MGKEDFIGHLDEKKEKTIEEYCEDIIHGHYYDLSKLIELNVIKTVYDENENAKWYITGSDQEYTSYTELRKGLEDYIWRMHNGRYYTKKEIFNVFEKLIETQKQTMILSQYSSLQMIGKIIFHVLSQLNKTGKNQWDTLEIQMENIFNSPLLINEVNSFTVTEFKQFETIIKNKNIKNIFINSNPNNIEELEILTWGQKLEVNVFFFELKQTDTTFTERFRLTTLIDFIKTAKKSTINKDEHSVLNHERIVLVEFKRIIKGSSPFEYGLKHAVLYVNDDGEEEIVKYINLTQFGLREDDEKEIRAFLKKKGYTL